MVYLHETHEISGGRMDAFDEALRTTWWPLLEAGGEARLLWVWHHTHGTGPSYQAVTLAAVPDWAAWGALADRMTTDAGWRDWHRRAGTFRREVTQKLLVPTSWSPLETAQAPPASAGTPGLYLHDTGWPFPGMRDDYVAALGTVFHPQTSTARMISVTGCWTVAPGAGRHHEVVLLQRIEDWPRFATLLTQGEQGAQRGGWMVEGLRFRDRWESKLLRCAAWSPRQ